MSKILFKILDCLMDYLDTFRHERVQAFIFGTLLLSVPVVFIVTIIEYLLK